MNKSYIEYKAWELQAQIWHQRDKLWPSDIPHPIDMLDPAVAARILGLRFEIREELGRFGNGQDRFEVAGMINQREKLIALSRRFPLDTRRYTAAHEIGHGVLHRGISGMSMHRDRPIKGFSEDDGFQRPPVEREADYFAACFLMPRRLLKKAFESTFLTKTPFVFNDDTAFMLCPSDPDSVLRAEVGSLDRALALASAISYAGRPFNSLASQFRVSVTTMAIRLRELHLIQE